MELLLVMWMVIANIQHKDWRRFSVKGQKANIFGLAGHRDSAPTTQFSSAMWNWCEMGHRHNINKWVWLCSRKMLFTKTGWGRIWPVSPGLQIPGHWTPGTVVRVLPGWSDFILTMILEGWMLSIIPILQMGRLSQVTKQIHGWVRAHALLSQPPSPAILLSASWTLSPNWILVLQPPGMSCSHAWFTRTAAEAGKPADALLVGQSLAAFREPSGSGAGRSQALCLCFQPLSYPF